jgi:hypothetical protein
MGQYFVPPQDERRPGSPAPRGFGARPELLILIAIVGIALAVGIPLLSEWRKQDEIRGAVADGIARTRSLREQIARVAERTNRFPTRADELDLAGFALLDRVSADHLERIRKRKPLPVAEVATQGPESALLWVRIEVTGELTLTYKLPLHNYPTLTYLPKLSAGRVSWSCASQDLKAKYFPAECQAQ